MTASQLLSIIGLLSDLVGVVLLAWPIFAPGGLYSRAKKIAEGRDWEKDDGGWAAEEKTLAPSSMEIVNQFRFGQYGLCLIILGFILQGVGVWLSNVAS